MPNAHGGVIYGDIRFFVTANSSHRAKAFLELFPRGKDRGHGAMANLQCFADLLIIFTFRL